MPTTVNFPAFVSTGAGRQAPADQTFSVPDGGTGRSIAQIGVLSETVPITSFTDGGAAVGTYQMIGSVPAGAILLISKITPVAGFIADTSATITVGDGSDVDRYHTGTPSIFTTAANGVECGVVSGTKLVTTANRPTLTVTTAADFTTSLTNATGIVKVEIYYLQT